MEGRKFPFISFSITVTISIFIFYGIGNAVILYFLPDEIQDDWQTHILGLSQVLFILLPTLLLANQIPIHAKKLFRLERFPDKKEIIYSLMALLMFQLFMSGYQEIQNALIPDVLSEIYDKLMKIVNESYSGLVLRSGFFSILGSLLFIALIPGGCEEFMMRGFLQRSLEEELSPAKAIVITGLLFGIIHFNPIHLVPLILIGFLLGFTAYITKSLYTSIILHFANNALSVIVMTYFIEEDTMDIPLPMYTAIPFFVVGGLLTLYFCYTLYKYSKEKNFKPQIEILPDIIEND